MSSLNNDPRLRGEDGKPLRGRARERAAADIARGVQRRSAAADTYAGDEYGAGKLTRGQRKSQDRDIPATPPPRTRGEKIRRSLWG